MNKKFAKLINFSIINALLCFCSISMASGNGSDDDFKKQLPSLIDDIKNSTAYSWGLAGTPSALSSAEKATQILYKNATDDVVAEIAKNSTLEGKMYLLCLLKKRNSNFYENVKNLVDVKNSEVTVFSGSVLSKTSAMVIVDQIEKFNCDHLQ